jgi:hypothetical protein
MAIQNLAGFTAAFGVATGTEVAADFSCMQVGDVVYWLNDFPSPVAANVQFNGVGPEQQYTIIAIDAFELQVSGDVELIDQSYNGGTPVAGNIATKASNRTNPRFPDGAFDHTTTYTGVATAQQVSRPWRAYIQKNTDVSQKFWVFQSELTDAAGINAYVDTYNSVWNP